jgi:hypothetical protein
MPTETVIANGEDLHDVEVKPLTIICHHGGLRIEPTGTRRVVGPLETVEAAEKIEAEEYAQRLATGGYHAAFKLVFEQGETPDAVLPENIRDLRAAPLSVKHIVGMLILLQDCARDGVQSYIRYPESYLHPKQQCGLADLFIRLGIVG